MPKNDSLPLNTAVSVKGATLLSKETAETEEELPAGHANPVRNSPTELYRLPETLRRKLPPGQELVSEAAVLEAVLGGQAPSPLRSQVERHLLRDALPHPHHPGPHLLSLL